MAARFDWKSRVPVTPAPRVRIPLSPPPALGSTSWDVRPLSRLLAPAGLALLLGLSSCDDKGTSPSSSLTATCSASPESGSAPLAVELNLKAAGSSSFDVTVDFGDGKTSVEGFVTTSRSLSLPHVYQAPGGYAATFLVSNPEGQSIGCRVGVTVKP